MDYFELENPRKQNRFWKQRLTSSASGIKPITYEMMKHVTLPRCILILMSSYSFELQNMKKMIEKCNVQSRDHIRSKFESDEVRWLYLGHLASGSPLFLHYFLGCRSVIWNRKRHLTEIEKDGHDFFVMSRWWHRKDGHDLVHLFGLLSFGFFFLVWGLLSFVFFFSDKRSFVICWM